MDSLDDESRSIIQSLIDHNPDGVYRANADERLVRERVAIIRPRIREGKLLVPKKTASIRFVNDKLEIKYISGFSDDRVNQALHWYSKGMNVRQIAQKTGINQFTLYNWLYTRMDLPRIRKQTADRDFRVHEIIRLYENERRPLEISGLVGCSPGFVYKILNESLGLEFGGGGPNPWVYESAENTITPQDVQKLDLRYNRARSRGALIYDTRERYQAVFKAVRKFEQNSIADLPETNCTKSSVLNHGAICKIWYD